MGDVSRLRVWSYDEHLAALHQACDWAGVTPGRGTEYAKLMKEFFEEGRRSRKHLLACNESWETIEIWRLWERRVDTFPGLKTKIRTALTKGPVLREDERASTSSNRPRNDAFTFFFAGTLLRAGVRVISVDGIAGNGLVNGNDADIAFDWRGSLVNVECKRPQTLRRLPERVEKARKQLTSSKRQGGVGIVSIDCSALIRFPGHLVETGSPERGELFVSEQMERMIVPKVATQFESRILGLIAFARVPAVTVVDHSRILSVHGVPIRHCWLDSISSWLGIGNGMCLDPSVVREVCWLLRP